MRFSAADFRPVCVKMLAKAQSLRLRFCLDRTKINLLKILRPKIAIILDTTENDGKHLAFRIIEYI